MKKLTIDIGNTFIKCGVFENNKIVVIHSIHLDYNWKKIAHSAIK